MKHSSVLITVVSTILMGVMSIGVINAGEVQAGVVTFYPESAIYAGNGCPQGKTHIIVDEMGDLLIQHEELILSLPQGVGSTLAGRKACSIRIPVTLPHGYYVRSIEQQIQYSVQKSAGAEARIATRAALSSDSINPFTVLLPLDDEIVGENMIDSRRDYLGAASRRARYCTETRSEELMLQINTVISGQRSSVDQDLIVAAYGGYLGEGFELEIAECP